MISGYPLPTRNSEEPIITTMHDTIPKYEFGYINETRGNYSIRLVFALLNPGDADTVTVISNRLSNLNLYAKSEGLSLKLSKNLYPAETMSEIIPLFAILISLMSVLLKEYSIRRKKILNLIKEMDNKRKKPEDEADSHDSNLDKTNS